MIKRKLTIFLGFVLIIISLLVIKESLTFPKVVVAGRKLPGPAFFPVLLSIVLILTGLCEIITGWRMPVGKEKFEWNWGTTNNVIIIFFLFVYVLLMRIFGYALSTFLFAFILMLRLKVRFGRAIVIAIFTVLFIVGIFGQVFHIQLPIGSIGLPW